MPTDEVELSRRTETAFEAIRRSLGTEAGEYGPPPTKNESPRSSPSEALG